MPIGGSRSSIVVRPLHQVTVQEDGAYVAGGNDPNFELTTDFRARAFTPGWFRLRVRVQVLDGFVVAPCLYPDYGDGMSEATRIDLPEPDAAGWIDAVVMFGARLHALRFDPTVQVARFRLDRFTLRRIGRLRAALRMLGVLGGQAGRFGRVTARGFALVHGALSGRLRESADQLAQAYAAAHRKSDRNYAAWLEMFEPAIVASPAGVSTYEAPLFSILLPVCDTPPRLLHACVESVIAQTDPRWQLCIADDASTRPDIVRLLEGYAERDPRIRVIYGRERAHISANTNRALQIATGRYIGFLDHDDELAADALEEVAAALEEHPGARMLYTDEDKLDMHGERHAPHFKPAWNPDLLRSLNYIAHFTVVEAALLRDLGGLRTGFEGAQDHDLALRCGEVLAPEQIVHIPRVLYHWRMIEGSTALGAQQKPYVLEAGRRAIAEHLLRTGVSGVVHVLPDGRYRIERDIRSSPPKVGVIIPTRDRVDLLRTCVESVLYHTRYPDYEIVVIDNGSQEPATLDYFDTLRKHDKVSIVADPGAFNFSRIVNDGVRATDADVICLLNNDIEAIRAGWLYEMTAQAARPEVGCVGAMLYYPDDTIQHAGVILGIGGVAGHSHCRLERGSEGYISRARVVQNMAAVTAACMAFRRDVFDRVGGFDESLAVAFNDVDFCLRVAAAGYVNVWTPFAELYHHESASRGAEDTPAKQARFRGESELMKRRWGAVLEADPFYNPNLSLESERFELAFPPRRVPSRTSRLDAPVAA